MLRISKINVQNGFLTFFLCIELFVKRLHCIQARLQALQGLPRVVAINKKFWLESQEPQLQNSPLVISLPADQVLGLTPFSFSVQNLVNREELFFRVGLSAAVIGIFHLRFSAALGFFGRYLVVEFVSFGLLN